VSCMHISNWEDSSCAVYHLIHEVLEVLVCQLLFGPDDSLQVTFHQVSHYINIL
jgi:hypothetical protein